MESQELRKKESKRFYNRIDPVFIFLNLFVFRSMFQPRISRGEPPTELDSAEVEFLIANLNKHRAILWANVIAAIYLVNSGANEIVKHSNAGLVVSGLLVPALITGAAWYSLTFGGIAPKFMGAAMTLTRWMFLSFSLSMTLVTVLLCKISPAPVALILIVIYLGLYISSVLFDNVDGLKIGLDTSMLHMSRATILSLVRRGEVSPDELLRDIQNQQKPPN